MINAFNHLVGGEDGKEVQTQRIEECFESV